MVLRRITESEVIIPAMLAIQNKPGMRMNELIKYLEASLPLSNLDRATNASRKDSKFSQIVRNLVSHRDINKFGKFVVKTGDKNSSFSINDAGIQYLTEFLKEAYLVGDEADYNATQELHQTIYTASVSLYGSEKLVEANNRQPCLSDKGGGKPRYITQPQIIKTVLSASEYKCAVDEEHKTFMTKSLLPYMEGHHLIPMRAQAVFQKNIDRSENICCLCPSCHRAVHYGDGREKRGRLQALYENNIEGLRREDLFIAFDDLVYKYYL